MSGCFYFISERFFKEFPDEYLMKNKDGKPGEFHDRPCFFSFRDVKHPKLLWLIPISSQVEKYKRIYHEKVEKYGYCSTIYFCNFLGNETTFLIQNMFPVTEKYIESIYLDKNEIEVRIDLRDEKKIIGLSKNILKAHGFGKRVLFADVEHIKKLLLKQSEFLFF
ncbi:MAG: hypothetical protein FWE54_07465 [Methanimicrococcus sp.]|nr:hypothetical protein [Methanimicrococcus sp.]